MDYKGALNGNPRNPADLWLIEPDLPPVLDQMIQYSEGAWDRDDTWMDDAYRAMESSGLTAAAAFQASFGS